MAIDKHSFSEKVDIEMVSDAEFFSRIRARRKDVSDANIARGRAYQFRDDSGKIRILVKKDGIPAKFLPYILEHEISEAYAADEEGLNIVSLARSDLAKALREQVPTLSNESIDRIFNQFVNEYNFDYKHELGVMGEYELAEKEGNLDRYHKFIMEMREDDLLKFADDPTAVRKTQNDIRIRQSVYSKIRNGTVHNFLRDLRFGN